MSGLYYDDAISISEDDVTYPEDELDVQEYDDNDISDEDEAIGDDSDDDTMIFEQLPPAFVPAPTEFEIPEYQVRGIHVRPNTVVELKDHSDRSSSGHRISGDFLLVQSIVEDVETEDVVFRGFRMRRCVYLQPLFDGKFNDLFLLLEVKEHDTRSPFVQGLQTVSPDEVVQVRECVFTNLSHQEMNLRNFKLYVPQTHGHQHQIKDYLFVAGKLFCRWVHVVELHRSGRSYGGEARRLYKREVAAFSLSSQSRPPTVPGSSRIANTSQKLHPHKRSRSVQEMFPSKCAYFQPEKNRVFTLGDGYCGCGGVSEGARQAGYKILWGLELDPLAMAAYRKNFPEAESLEMDAHDFPEIARRSTHGCDHLHMSCPCCFWSECHTVEGQNDEANMLTIYTVEPWLRRLKPTTFSLEQAPGLIKLEKHKLFFRNLINAILAQGYNVRWKVQDQAWFGIGQHRRRLVFIGAKIGFPLPPFPAPVHGPPGSGLKRYVTIEDALKVISHQHMSFANDIYHQPQRECQVNKEAIDPHVNLAKCLTTSGGDNVHYTGRRNNTVRELAAFQGFPVDFRFAGPVTQARKQCGNAWPVKANKVYFLLWAAHREAFEHGLIDAEDEVSDLYDFLTSKGIDIPRAPTIDLDLFNGSSSRVNGKDGPDFRYLQRIERTVQPRIPLQLWARGMEIDPLPQRRRRNAPIQPLVNSLLNNVEETGMYRTTLPIRRKRRVFIEVYIDDDVDPTFIEESCEE